MQSAFRVQGIQAILYNRLSSGIVCSCKSKDKQVLARNGDAQHDEVGAADRTNTTQQFGIGTYNPSSPDADFDDDNFHEEATSPNNPLANWMGDAHRVGHERDGANVVLDISANSDTGQFSPELDDVFSAFDLGSIGFSDVSCPVCFGSGYVGGYSQFRGWRQVVAATQITDTTSTLDLSLSTLALRPGTHQFALTLPLGCVLVDVFRALNGDKVIPAQILIDGQDTANKRLLNWFDGRVHVITIVAADPFTHFEAQAATTLESVYFEFPKRTKSADISLFEKTEPFQIIMGPEVPQLDTLDIIAESQTGKFLIVQTTNDWQTRNSQMLGFECTVRVAQPAELWRILPQRRYVDIGQKTTKIATPTQARVKSGLAPGNDGFSF